METSATNDHDRSPTEKTRLYNSEYQVLMRGEFRTN